MSEVPSRAIEADAGLAPVALFAFRRVGPLARTLASLKACPEFEHSPVYVFSDAARTASQEREVDEVRALIQGQLTPNMRLICAPRNRGLAESIIKGVTELCETYGRVIVIEDDLLVSPSILTWFNQALDRFADCEKVMQVSGHMFHVPALARRREGLFLPFTTSWGWATWKRAWDAFDPQAQGWEELRRDRALRKRFNLDGHYNYARMLARQMRGELDSWAIRWYWSVFRKQRVMPIPASDFSGSTLVLMTTKLHTWSNSQGGLVLVMFFLRIKRETYVAASNPASYQC